ncbi:MAG: UDP-N-acetylmuramoyl-tripeptide--D-alanyl-D-alanine ligase [Candidatus Brocadiaceae bacterium]|nr:UDP-N-acetylmuramoyl-tripeptide--D-alanyl-D-alanine ligase [Candidatus Brocadiaceae bacterium]
MRSRRLDSAENRSARFTAGEIAHACAGELAAGDAATPACGVATDTRRTVRGRAFFALVGERFDGHDYLGQAVAAGARVLAVQHVPDGWRAPKGVAVVRVRRTACALLALAGHYRRSLRARVVAITGSYGKSTVKTMLGAILAHAGRCTVAPASFNNRIGVALSLLSARTDDDYVVLEMGTNHPGEIDELAAAARPDVGVVTAIGEVHLDGLGSLQGVVEAKAELIGHLNPAGTLVLNADDPRCLSMAPRFAGRIATYGTHPSADVAVTNVDRDGSGWAFEALGRRCRLASGACHDVLNAAGALCAAAALGVPAGQAALAGVARPPMRYERIELAGVTFIRDCYNSNPPALRAALRSFLLEPAIGRRAVVCGDMLELGLHAGRLHRELGADLAASGADIVAAVGQMALEFVAGWCTKARPGQRAFRFASAEEAWLPLWRQLRPGDMVLLKGSRALHLETITDAIAAHLAQRRKEAVA